MSMVYKTFLHRSGGTAMTDEAWIAFLQRMARNGSKPYTGSAKPPRGYQKRMRLAYRRMLKDALAQTRKPM